MQLKKSINAKDIIDYQERKLNDTIQNEQVQNNQLGHNYKSKVVNMDMQMQENSRNHNFLSKIRENKSKNRYRTLKVNKQAQPYIDKSHIYIAPASQSQQNSFLKKCTPSLDNYPQNQSKLSQNKYCSIGSKSHSAKKVILPIRKSRKLTSTSNFITQNLKQMEQDNKRFKNSAKLIEISPEINKKKLLDKRQQERIKKHQKSYLKQNAYQLSVSRKNINLLKMKLNSLGSQADDSELNTCKQVYNMIRQSEIRNTVQLNIKRMYQIKLKFDNNKKFYVRKDRKFQNKSMTMDLKQKRLYTEQQISHKQNKVSRTIQIRQIPKYTLKMDVFGNCSRVNKQQRYIQQHNKKGSSSRNVDQQ